RIFHYGRSRRSRSRGVRNWCFGKAVRGHTHAMASWPGLSLHLTTIGFVQFSIARWLMDVIHIHSSTGIQIVIWWEFYLWYWFNNGKRFNFNLLTDMFIMGQIMDRHDGPKIKSLKLTRSLTSFITMGCNHL
ncbi:hypothetical protein LINPERHAP1_LOCUS21920, partial [Linum perenne]